MDLIYFLWGTSQLIWPAVQSLERGLSTNPGIASCGYMPSDTRCMNMVSVCLYVCGNVCCVAAVDEDSVFNLGVLKYAVCLCKGCNGCCVFCLYCEAWIESVSVLSCRCGMFVSCVYPVAVLNVMFCMACSLLILVEDARGDHMEEAYPRVGDMTALYVAMSVSFLFTPSCCGECFYYL